MPTGKLSPHHRKCLRREIRNRVTAGERRSVVARELAAKYGVSPTAVYWHMGKELAPRGKRVARSESRQKAGGRMERFRDEFERLLDRDMEIRKAHAENLAAIHALNLSVSRHMLKRLGPLSPLVARSSGAVKGTVPGLQSFGSRLKELRKARGLTLAQVARGVGTNKSYLSGMELGRVRPPSAKYVTKIARFLSIDERELHRLAQVEKAPPEIRDELVRAFWLSPVSYGIRGLHSCR